MLWALAGGSSLEDAAKAAGTKATTGTYATYVDPDAEKTDDSDKKSDDTESKESSKSSDSKTKDSVYTTNNLDQSVVDALNSLEEGQTSDLITTDSTYYIVRLDKKTDEEATESNRKTVKGNKEDKYYNGILSGWQDDEKWSVKQKQLDKIKIHNYFTTTLAPITDSPLLSSTVPDTVLPCAYAPIAMIDNKAKKNKSCRLEAQRIRLEQFLSFIPLIWLS